MTYELVSQQVSWSEVHAFVLPRLIEAIDWPMIGSPAWCRLDDEDPAKWASVLDAAQQWALRVEYFQQARCEASHDISGAVNWPAMARYLHRREEFFADRPWMRRVTR
jgi:hypothetical protein